MRENPDTSLKLLQMLANEPDYPSRLTIRHLPTNWESTGTWPNCT